MNENDARDTKLEQSSDDESTHRTPRITTLNIISVSMAAILVVVAFMMAGQLLVIDEEHDRAYRYYNDCENAATDLMIVSDYLTTQSRMYVMTGDRSYLDGYLQEFFVDQNREAAVNVLITEAGNEHAVARLNAALGESNELATYELYAMKLTAQAVGTSPMPVELANINISNDDDKLSNVEKRQLSEKLVLGDSYQVLKSQISTDVDECAKELVKELGDNVRNIELRVEGATLTLSIIIFALLAMVVFSAVTNYVYVMRPMRIHAKDIAAGKPLSVIGSREIKDVSNAYNSLYYRTVQQTESLRHQAETDPLTGVLNRGSYDKLMDEASDDLALVLADVDEFKEVNDTYGHEAGDAVLKKVASIIESHFRGSDYVCRIGGDEFAVILTKIKPENRKVIEMKLDSIAKELAENSDDIPDVTLSFGIAFSEDLKDGDTLYHLADKALYASKKSGRNAASFYTE